MSPRMPEPEPGKKEWIAFAIVLIVLAVIMIVGIELLRGWLT